MAGEADPDTQRSELIDCWDRAAEGWGRRVDRVRSWGMPVSAWMIEHLGLQPGQTVLELAAGPGDTGFLAAELVAPGGKLICSDATAGMLAVARARARELGVRNVEFKQLQLEWIDLPTASVDGALCRWGVMLTLDPGAAAREVRRVLRSGGRCALAVWDEPERNPWATIPTQALVSLDLAQRPDPNAPGMFALASEARLRELLADAGFVDVAVEAVPLERVYASVAEFLEETADLSLAFSDVMSALDKPAREQVDAGVAELCRPLQSSHGELRLPGRSLIALGAA